VVGRFGLAVTAALSGIAGHGGSSRRGDKQCSPGQQNNVDGGPGNSGPGDKAGAPLKPLPPCPGTK
jgi:hypothetical protein